MLVRSKYKISVDFEAEKLRASAKLIDEGSISGRGGTGLRDYLEFIAGCKSFIEENLFLIYICTIRRAEGKVI